MTVRFIWGEHPVSLQLHCISSADRAALRGLRCPECRHPLIPVHPAARAKHFRHAIDSSCSGGLETVAHRVAKQILCDGLTLMLPERTCLRWPHPSGLRTSEILAPLSAVSVIGGRQEVTLASGHRADVICDVQRRHRQIRPLLVEVCVHHSVDDAKAAALREADHHAIEIDVPEALALMPLAQARDYLSRRADRRWLSDPTGDRWARLSRSKALPLYRAARLAEVEKRRLKRQAAAEADVRRRRVLEEERIAEVSRQHSRAQQRAESDQRLAYATAEAAQILSLRQSQADARWAAEPASPYVAIVEGEQLGRFVGIMPDGVIGFVPSPASWQAAALFDLFLRPIDDGEDVLDPALTSHPLGQHNVVSILGDRMRSYPSLFVCKDFFRWTYGPYSTDPIGWKRTKQLAGYFDGPAGCGTPSYVIAEVALVWARNLSLIQFWRDRNLGRGKWAAGVAAPNILRI